MKLETIIQVMLWLAYPVVIFFGIQYFQPRYVAILLAILLVIRWRHEARHIVSGMSKTYIAVFMLLLTAISITTITNNEALLRLYPALVNGGMLLIFSVSLRYPPTIIERFARLHEPNLSVLAIAYTRRVTQVWCIFFIVNGSLALYTALYASREIWAWYNGFVAYLLMGTLFGIEWLIRRRLIANQMSVHE
jgi:uncharacterized membrane protein